MDKDIITLDTAILAHEKGFKFIFKDIDDDWKADYYEPNNIRYHYHRDSKKYYPLSDYYSDTNQNIQQYWDKEHPHIDAPTQALLQKWLREIYNIDVQSYLITMEYNGRELEIIEEKEYFYRIYIKGITQFIGNTNYKNKYEAALEEGLQQALKLIKL